MSLAWTASRVTSMFLDACAHNCSFIAWRVAKLHRFLTIKEISNKQARDPFSHFNVCLRILSFERSLCVLERSSQCSLHGYIEHVTSNVLFSADDDNILHTATATRRRVFMARICFIDSCVSLELNCQTLHSCWMMFDMQTEKVLNATSLRNSKGK